MIRISGVIRESIVDGPGIRFVVFTQGCPHNCPGCHNPSTHDINGGYLIEDEKILKAMGENPLLKGLTISGGEPFLQAQNLINLAKSVRENGKDVVIYTGYTYEELISTKDKDILELLSLCDVLIDGRFEMSQRDLTLTFKGSRNQRILDMKKTAKYSSPYLLEM